MAQKTSDKKIDPSKSAVALKYDRGKDPAPRMIAKGKGNVAEQIIRVALDNNIEVREDSDLVEILENLDIDAIIPLEAYAAIAEILSYVYKSNAKARERINRLGSSA
jgi:flagellar biosynthesis protein